MAPEIGIPIEKVTAVRSWLEQKAAELSFVDEAHTGIWLVDGEPLVILSYGRKLWCTKEHAKELEQAGIIQTEESGIIKMGTAAKPVEEINQR